MSDNWLLNHPPGRVITRYQIAEIFGKAYERNATMGKGIKGFKVCGIFPVNRNVFSDDDFLSSSVTVQTIPVDNPDEDLGLHERIPTEHCAVDVTDQSTFDEPNRGEINEEVTTPVREHTVKQWTSPADVLPLPKRTEAQKRKMKKPKSKRKIDQPGTSNDSIRCPACEEDFKEPPEENWIQVQNIENGGTKIALI
ncbi:hypothetical protein J6590_006904 [Homalodisca vitripennis]|nr:hypothetical protein J6590_006904 [Homalodisca vitripennis]